MISDIPLRNTGRDKDLHQLFRLANKGINVILEGSAGYGRTFILRYLFEAFANGSREQRKPVYLRAYGTRRDFEELLFIMSENGDIRDEDCREQTFAEFRKGSQQQLERRILLGLKNADRPYIIFLEEKKRLPETMRLFLREVLGTGKASIIAEPADMADAKARNFYQGFDRYEIRPLNDGHMAALFSYLVRESSIRIKEEDLEEIRRRILNEVAGNPGRLIEFIRRGGKERELRKEMLERLPSSNRREVSVAWICYVFMGFGLISRYVSRGTGSVSGTITGGIICVISLLCFRLISRGGAK